MVPVRNSVHFINALVENEVAFESHIYSNGLHGFSTCDSSVQMGLGQFCNRVPHWVGDSIEWLKDVLGDFGPNGMEVPRFGGRLNGNHDETLNVDCTVGYLMTKPSAAGLLETIMKMGQTEGQDQRNEEMANGMDPTTIQAIIQHLTLRQMLELGKVPKEMVVQLDGQLRKIGNK